MLALVGRALARQFRRHAGPRWIRGEFATAFGGERDLPDGELEHGPRGRLVGEHDDVWGGASTGSQPGDNVAG